MFGTLEKVVPVNLFIVMLEHRGDRLFDRKGRNDDTLGHHSVEEHIACFIVHIGRLECFVESHLLQAL